MPTLTLEQKIEAILLFKNEPVSLTTLAELLKESRGNLQSAISNLQKEYENRGIVIVFDGEEACFGTNPVASPLIEEMQKDEFSRELGRAGLETLSIILYKGPVSRKEIDYIRGVNSGFIIRNLLIRGLIERSDTQSGESGRSYSYKPTVELLRHLGVRSKEELPEFGTALREIQDFIQNSSENADQ